MWKTTQNVYGQKQSEGKKIAQQLLQALYMFYLLLR